MWTLNPALKLWIWPISISLIDANGDTPISFGSEIDPHNILSNALSHEFVHLQENKVEYYEAQQGPDDVLK